MDQINAALAAAGIYTSTPAPTASQPISTTTSQTTPAQPAPASPIVNSNPLGSSGAMGGTSTSPVIGTDALAVPTMPPLPVDPVTGVMNPTFANSLPINPITGQPNSTATLGAVPNTTPSGEVNSGYNDYYIIGGIVLVVILVAFLV